MNNPSISFDRAAEFYDETRGFPPGEEARVADFLARSGGLPVTSRILEIGIGTGRIALPLSAKVGAVFGADLSSRMLARLLSKKQGEAVFPVQADATRLPYSSHVFDAAVTVHVFHLIPAWREALAELARVLKPDGRLLHCWTEEANDSPTILIRKAFDAALPAESKPDVGVAWKQNSSFLSEEGWRAAGETQFYAYTDRQSPDYILQTYRERKWSRSWRLSDAEMAAGMGAAEAAVRQHFSDPSLPTEIKTDFFMRVYQPPAR
jgi:ubiquinone/menaquinone biosynthesis C-methylase UbiE